MTIYLCFFTTINPLYHKDQINKQTMTDASFTMTDQFYLLIE